jgi:hypothetical protein
MSPAEVIAALKYIFLPPFGIRQTRRDQYENGIKGICS